MTIRTISGQFIGGATLKKDQPESPNDGRLVGRGNDWSSTKTHIPKCADPKLKNCLLIDGDR
jgi:hypothetical protein